MKAIVTALAIFLAFSSVTSFRIAPKIFYRHDYIFSNQYQAFYKYESSPATWSDAFNSCISEKAKLFFPQDIDELEDMKKNIDDLEEKTVHVAMTKSDEMGGFYTIDGKPLGDVFSNRLEADFNVTKGDCVALANMKNLSTVGCDVRLPFICKKKFNEIALPCNTVDEGYIFSPQYSKCFKVHKTRATWAKAFQICQNEDARLAVPVKNSNNDYMLFSIASAQVREYKRSYESNRYFVGIRPIFHDTFVDLSGNLIPSESLPSYQQTPRQISSYDYGEDNGDSEPEVLPVVSNGVSFCGTLISDQQLQAAPCYSEEPFICEKLA